MCITHTLIYIGAYYTHINTYIYIYIYKCI